MTPWTPLRIWRLTVSLVAVYLCVLMVPSGASFGVDEPLRLGFAIVGILLLSTFGAIATLVGSPIPKGAGLLAFPVGLVFVWYSIFERVPAWAFLGALALLLSISFIDWGNKARRPEPTGA